MAPKTPLPPSKRPRRYRTTRGMRRLSYAEAYGNRTTDSSRARVMKLYDRTAPPKVTLPGGRRVEVGKAETPRNTSTVTTPSNSAAPRTPTSGGGFARAGVPQASGGSGSRTANRKAPGPKKGFLLMTDGTRMREPKDAKPVKVKVQTPPAVRRARRRRRRARATGGAAY